MVFSTFFNFSLILVIRSSWSEPQSTPGLVFAGCMSFSIFGCNEYNQSDFGVDHLVMSMCRVFSCVVGRGCFLWPVHSLGKILLAFALLLSVLQGQIYLYKYAIPVVLKFHEAGNYEKSLIILLWETIINITSWNTAIGQTAKTNTPK